MFPKTKKIVTSLTVAFAAAAAFTVAVPSGNAFAIDHVPCDGNRNDFLKIWSHLDGRDSVDCYANGGRTSFGNWWVDRISTGNNDLVYYDANGDSVKVPRWTDITYPNRPPLVKDIEIL
ncbi:beta/gamma crystallin domain-containing protein [Kitasatospora sp. NPDC056783]|uniref:beta/gamma crystallin domain-containing protein n=1 Tax=Kitasatospora sp. NPDC056783 TaxID=3345943 RepID=UPI0036B832B0